MKDMIELDREQERFARVLPGLEDFTYGERFNRLVCFSWGDKG